MPESQVTMISKSIQTQGTIRLYITPVDSEQAFITARPASACDSAKAAAEAYDALAGFLAAQGMAVVHERVFGSLCDHETIVSARAQRLAAAGMESDSPKTFLVCNPLWGSGLAGVSMMAVRPGRPDDVWTVRGDDGSALGRGWRRLGATFMILQNLSGFSPQAPESPSDQTDRMLDRAAEILRGQSATYRHVARTWMYLHRILTWYDDFNRVRNAKYGTFGLMPEPQSGNGRAILLPASTGIEAATPSGAAVTMDLLATKLDDDAKVELHQMTNERQKDAFKYGSAFSRGAAIRLPEATWISLSGTAAIDEKGVSKYIGDFRAQMNDTLNAVEALIAQEGASLKDLCDATCFVKRPEHVEMFHEILAERGLSDMPAVPVLADVCRDDLLFEIDGAAVARRP